MKPNVYQTCKFRLLTLHRPALGFAFVVVCYLSATCSLLVSWDKKGLYTPTGDEPHYLVIASAIAKYHTFEVTTAYKDEFNERRFHPGLIPAGHKPIPGQLHWFLGPHGIYSVHNIGLPLLLAPLISLGFGTGAARLLMLTISLLVPVLAWRSASIFIPSLAQRIVAAAAISLSAPFIYASGQIYPDLPAGAIFALVALGILRERFGNLEESDAANERRWLKVVLSSVLLAFVPWLQIKFVAPLVVCVVAGLVLDRASLRRNPRAAVLWVGLPIVSLAALALYNHYAFSRFSGPYAGTALELSQTALAVLVGLHIDQFQGIFLSAPILLAACVGLGALLRRDWQLAGFLALLYASLVVPNAMHPNWYGGGSFAGRFVLSGAAILILPAAYGIGLLMRGRPRLGFWLCGFHFVLQGLLWVGYSAGQPTLYNFVNSISQQPLLGHSPSFYEPVERFLPYLYLNNLWLHHWPNFAWLVALVCLFVAGWFSAPAQSRKAIVWVWLLSAPTIIAIGSVAALSEDYRINLSKAFDAAELPGLVGSIDGKARVAREGRDPAGFLTFGPYILLPPGHNTFRLKYMSHAGLNDTVGTWDVTLNLGKQQLASGKITGTNGSVGEISGEFVIKGFFQQVIEIRSYFDGRDDLTILRLEIARER